MGSEAAPLHQAFGRVLPAPLTFPADRPERDLALVDGYAVQAASTLGASTYNPLSFTIVPKGMPLTAGCASVCHAGETLPSGADAVLPVDVGEAVGTTLEVCDAVALGFGVARTGQAAQRDGVAIEAGRRLGIPQIALAASLGVTQLIVRRRPVVTLVFAGPKPPAIEALCLAISALVARDGGVAHCARRHPDMARMLSCVAPADLFLVVGRSGWGEDDDAVHVITAADGRIDHHGLALTPGGSAGLGWLRGTPLLLLPGDPLTVFLTYELLAGRLLRRLAGRATDFPFPIQRLVLSRKIVSPVGVSEFVPVVCHVSSRWHWRRLTGWQAMPGPTDFSLSPPVSKVMPLARWSTSSRCWATSAGRKNHDFAGTELSSSSCSRFRSAVGSPGAISLRRKPRRGRNAVS
jgi:molybdopterin molybdotransferase